MIMSMIGQLKKVGVPFHKINQISQVINNLNRGKEQAAQ